MFRSEYRCNSHLQLCLAGAPWPLGLLTMEKQQGHEFSFLHLHGNCLRLWIFSCNLHPSSGEIFYWNSFWLILSCEKHFDNSLILSLYLLSRLFPLWYFSWILMLIILLRTQGHMDSSVWMAALVFYRGGSLPVWLSFGDDFLACSPWWPSQNCGCSPLNHCCSQHSSCCWL